MTRPGPLESAARDRVRDVRARLYAAPAVPDDGVACPSASQKTPSRFVVVPAPEPVLEIAPETVNAMSVRLCAACRKKMRAVKNMPIEGCGILPDKRADILRRIADAEQHSVADCITAVIVYLDIRRELVLSHLRAKPLVRARQIAMWLGRNETSRSLPEVGRRTGGRNHTTALHACRTIDKIIATRSEPDVADAALALRDLFRGEKRESTV